MTYAIILAGGVGSRFWPLSRLNQPKQFLNICSEKPMLEETVIRISGMIKKENIYIAANKIYYKKIKDCLKGLAILGRNVFLEPSSRNNLAPILFLASRIYQRDKEAIILALPCDHYIKDRPKFLRALKKAVSVAEKGYIVSLGISPDRPETGYGYIKVKHQQGCFYPVARFIEKPGLKSAKRFIRDKRFYWNAGIFIFKAKVMLRETQRLTPEDFGMISRINDKKSLLKIWPRLRRISIDYAVMQKCRRLALIPADFDWRDLGSWQAIEQVNRKDRYGNVFRGQCVDLGSKETIAWSDNRLLATLGLDNIIVVNTRDAVLVCAKDRAQDIKKLVEIIKRKKLSRLT